MKRIPDEDFIGSPDDGREEMSGEDQIIITPEMRGETGLMIPGVIWAAAAALVLYMISGGSKRR